MESPLGLAINQERKRKVFERGNGPGNKMGVETLEEDQTVVNIVSYQFSFKCCSFFFSIFLLSSFLY